MVPETSELAFDSRTVDDIVVLAPRGTLDVTSTNQLRNRFEKMTSGHPKGLVVDLTGLDIAVPSLLTIFATAHAQLSEWPGIPLVVTTNEPTAARFLERWMPVRNSVPAAVAAIGEPPPRLVDRVLLPNEPASVQVARRFARDSCELWGHPELADDAALLLGELVANTVVHTASPVRVRVELRRGLLSVAAGDDDPRRPRPRDAHGGLARVARTARAWGSAPTPNGGKVVWATLRVAGGQPVTCRVSRGERP